MRSARPPTAALPLEAAQLTDSSPSSAHPRLCTRDFVCSLRATTPAASSSNGGGSSGVHLSAFDQNIDRSIALEYAYKGGERAADEDAGGEHRWAEQLALEVGEEGQLLGLPLEAVWNGDDLLFQSLGF